MAVGGISLRGLRYGVRGYMIERFGLRVVEIDEYI